MIGFLDVARGRLRVPPFPPIREVGLVRLPVESFSSLLILADILKLKLSINILETFKAELFDVNCSYSTTEVGFQLLVRIWNSLSSSFLYKMADVTQSAHSNLQSFGRTDYSIVTGIVTD